MGLHHSPKIVTDGLIFYYDMGNPHKSWRGAPTFNAVLQDGQNGVNPLGGDGGVVLLGMEPTLRFRNRRVARVRTGTSGNFYVNGPLKLSESISSTVWTATFYLKRVDETPLSTVGMYLYVSGNSNVNSVVSVTPVEDGWYKAVYTRSGLVSGTPSLIGVYSFGASVEYFVADWQCENLAISTPWVSGTRTNTQAILDITGNTTATANALVYNADGSFNFNGVNTCISIPRPALGSGPHTLLQWVRPAVSLVDSVSSNNRRTPFGSGGHWNPGMWLTARVFRVHSATEWRDLTIDWLDDTSWHQIGQTYDGTTCRHVLDGEILLGTRGAYAPSVPATLLFGAETTGGNATYNWNGDISITQIYNRELSAAEVQQNYNAIRGRYGV